VQKGEHLENKGREASSYLWWIIENYDKLPDEIYLLQGNPFEHCNEDFTPKWIAESDKEGCPHHCALRISEIAEPLKIELPEKWDFITGANLKLTKKDILRYDIDWYKKAFDLSMSHEQGAWIFERLWALIYKQ
jgi:hypothetical protein